MQVDIWEFVVDAARKSLYFVAILHKIRVTQESQSLSEFHLLVYRILRDPSKTSWFLPV